MKFLKYLSAAIVILFIINLNTRGAQSGPDTLFQLFENHKYKDDMSKPSDPLMHILWKYSPDAYIILQRSEMMAGEIKIGSIPVHMKNGPGRSIETAADGTIKETILTGKGYLKWINKNKPFIDQVSSLEEAVHEQFHLYFDKNGAFLLKDKIENVKQMSVRSADSKMVFFVFFGTCFLDKDSQYYSIKRGSHLQEYPSFPSSRMASSIPKENRTTRFNNYILKSSTESTQVNGISGLLNEYNAYYWTCKVVYDLYNYSRTEQPQTTKNWENWIDRAFNYYYSWAEFRYFILQYLIYAEKNEPNIYASMMNDRHLRKAFTEIDDRFTVLIQDLLHRLAVELPTHLNSYNIKVRIEEMPVRESGLLTRDTFYIIGNGLHTMNLKHYKVLRAELGKSEYIRMANMFRMTPQRELPVWPQEIRIEK
jgi:hypothetical protein